MTPIQCSLKKNQFFKVFLKKIKAIRRSNNNVLPNCTASEILSWWLTPFLSVKVLSSTEQRFLISEEIKSLTKLRLGSDCGRLVLSDATSNLKMIRWKYFFVLSAESFATLVKQDWQVFETVSCMTCLQATKMKLVQRLQTAKQLPSHFQISQKTTPTTCLQLHKIQQITVYHKKTCGRVVTSINCNPGFKNKQTTLRFWLSSYLLNSSSSGDSSDTLPDRLLI